MEENETKPRKAAEAPDSSAEEAASSRRGFSRETLGDFLRVQRRIAGLSLRQLADISKVSNAYLSQIERGLHIPSLDVLHAVARGLNVSAETLLDQVGLFEDPATVRSGEGRAPDTESAIALDPRLRPSQRQALLAVYRSYVAENAADQATESADVSDPVRKKSPTAKARKVAKAETRRKTGAS